MYGPPSWYAAPPPWYATPPQAGGQVRRLEEDCGELKERLDRLERQIEDLLAIGRPAEE